MSSINNPYLTYSSDDMTKVLTGLSENDERASKSANLDQDTKLKEAQTALENLGVSKETAKQVTRQGIVNGDPAAKSIIDTAINHAPAAPRTKDMLQSGLTAPIEGQAQADTGQPAAQQQQAQAPSTPTPSAPFTASNTANPGAGYGSLTADNYQRSITNNTPDPSKGIFDRMGQRLAPGASGQAQRGMMYDAFMAHPTAIMTGEGNIQKSFADAGKSVAQGAQAETGAQEHQARTTQLIPAEAGAANALATNRHADLGRIQSNSRVAIGTEGERMRTPGLRNAGIEAMTENRGVTGEKISAQIDAINARLEDQDLSQADRLRYQKSKADLEEQRVKKASGIGPDGKPVATRTPGSLDRNLSAQAKAKHMLEESLYYTQTLGPKVADGTASQKEMDMYNHHAARRAGAKAAIAIIEPRLRELQGGSTSQAAPSAPSAATKSTQLDPVLERARAIAAGQ